MRNLWHIIFIEDKDIGGFSYLHWCTFNLFITLLRITSLSVNPKSTGKTAKGNRFTLVP